MYCRNCGHELNSNDKFCRECGTKIEEAKHETTVKTEKQLINGMNNDTFLCILSLILMYGCGLTAYFVPLPFVTRFVFFFAPLVAVILAIYAKVNYPESKFAKYLLIVYIVQIVLLIIVVTVFLITCLNGLSKCGQAGEIINLLW